MNWFDWQAKLKKRSNFMGGILPITWAQVPAEVVAGASLAAIAIPEVMGYAQIAGMPIVTGLYTLLIPTVLYALFGSSRHLVVGADSATAAIMAAGLTGLATTASAEYVAYAGILALIAAFFLFMARLVKLGFLADFLSRTVLIGFLTGVGIQVAISQLPGMLGILGDGTDVIHALAHIFQQSDQINQYTLLVSAIALGIILICKKINPKIPGRLIAVAAAIVTSISLHLSQLGVDILGSVSQGFPTIGFPGSVPLSLNTLYHLLGVAFSMFIVILAQSAATSRAYAVRYSEEFSENVDLVGLSLANIGAGLSGTFIVNGSPTKTQAVDNAGGRTQLSVLTTSAITLLALLFLTQSLSFMPKAVLSAIVFTIGIEMIDVKGMSQIYRERPVEFWVSLITVLVVVFIGVEQGILSAIVLSILIHTRHGYKPKDVLVTVGPTGKPHTVPISVHAELQPGLMIYRFHHSMYYANAELMQREILNLIDSSQPTLNWFCIDATAVDDVDFSAAATLREIHHLLAAKQIRLVMTAVENDVRRELDVSGLTDLIGKDAYFETFFDVAEAYQKMVASSKPAT
jgi:high affinity sulfate transporter 1